MLTGHDDTDDGVNLNRQVDPTLGSNTSFGGNPFDVALRQSIFFTGFAIAFCLCCCFVKRRIPALQQRRLLRLQQEHQRRNEMTPAQLEQRKAFVDKQLPVRIHHGAKEEEEADIENALDEHKKKKAPPRIPSVDDLELGSSGVEAGEPQQEVVDVVEEQSEEEEMMTDENACSICLNSYKNGDEVSWSLHPDCPHEFHTECIRAWLLRHKECPMCRLPFLNEEPTQEEEEEEDEPQQQQLELSPTTTNEATTTTTTTTGETTNTNNDDTPDTATDATPQTPAATTAALPEITAPATTTSSSSSTVATLAAMESSNNNNNNNNEEEEEEGKEEASNKDAQATEPATTTTTNE